MTKKDLQEEELSKVTGGFKAGDSITAFDSCHFKPSKWKKYQDNISQGTEGQCNFCAHNPHRNWQDSYCGWSNVY